VFYVNSSQIKGQQLIDTVQEPAVQECGDQGKAFASSIYLISFIIIISYYDLTGIPASRDYRETI